VHISHMCHLQFKEAPRLVRQLARQL
jgi:hypothetical protein